jgi:UDP-N-acetylmuramoyl-L-alanyl-D-glutamate--2,6-diaminopimelate ligase
MLLHDLLRSFDPEATLSALPNIPVGGVKEDSRQIHPGDLFVARPGTKSDGRDYLADAHQRGAIAAVVAQVDAACPLPQLPTADPASAASRLAHLFFQEPTQTVRVLGVTGTNGKTTTAYLVRHLLNKSKKRCGLIGTVQIDDTRKAWEATLTTPSGPELAGLIAKMRNHGSRACAMEVSSHALDQGRVAGMRFAAAAFTNLTGDHLDYHKTMDNYAAAKSRLFQMLDADAFAVINAGDTWSDRMIRGCRAKIIRFGFTSASDYRAEEVSITSQGSRFRLRGPDGVADVSMSLIGEHNIENALTAAALVGSAFGLSVDQIAGGLSDASGAPGRLQAIRAGQPFAVLVDYAHTDDALENVLNALRPLTKGSLRVLFGCGGDRDRTKRPRMAAIAQKLADVVYVTSDNPRTETPAAIINEIGGGFSADFRPQVIVEPDRRRAIERVLAESSAEDVVLIAGKGHENYQIVGSVKHHFDDVEEATRVLSARTRAA